MFDLFLALFGGAYYASKIGNEKIAHKRASDKHDIIINNAKIDFDNWISNVVDEELEYNLGKELKTNPEVCFQKIIDDVNELGLYPHINSYNELRSAINTSEFGAQWEYKIPMRMLMAKSGKILKNDAWFSITSPRLFDYAEKQRWIRHHKFMTWIDKELQSHGIEPMLFWCNHNISPLLGEKSQPVSDIKNPTYGIYYWKSNRFYCLFE